MLHKQNANIFGFCDFTQDCGYFQKTASFFNPTENEGESSFSTQNTDATRENSSQSTPQQSSKGDPQNDITNDKRLITLKLNTHAKNQSCANIPIPSLISQKSSPPLEKAKEDKTLTLIKSCMSQQNIRERLISFKELAKPIAFHPSGKPVKHQRTPSAQLNGNSMPIIPNIKCKIDSESSTDQESFTGQPEPVNNHFMIRTTSKTRIKVAKVNKIKVISTIPGIENIAPIVNRTLERTSSVKKDLHFPLKKNSLLEIQLEEPRSLSNRSFVPNHVQSCQNHNSHAFLFSEADCSLPKLSPITPSPMDCRLLSNASASVTPVKKIAAFQFNSAKFEPANRLLEGRTMTAGAEENGLRARNYNSDTVKYQFDENINLTSLVSTQVRPVSNVYSVRATAGLATETITPYRFQPSEMKIKIKKRPNPKFKNEEAVLNKLFSSINQA